MGVILQGILGGFSGKVGPVVGGKWKSIDYMRSYVVPSNPNTAGQQTVRLKFKKLVAIARDFLPVILQPYWDPFQSAMSGFNAFIKTNYFLLSAGNLLDADCVATKGTLEPVPVSTVVKVAGAITITFSSVISGNGLSTDTVIGGAYNNVTGIYYAGATGRTRASGTVAITVPSGDASADFYCFAFAHRGTGSDLVVSDSSSKMGS